MGGWCAHRILTRGWQGIKCCIGCTFRQAPCLSGGFQPTTLISLRSLFLKLFGEFERLFAAEGSPCATRALPITRQFNACKRTLTGSEADRFVSEGYCLRILALSEAQLRKLMPQPGVAWFDAQRAFQRRTRRFALPGLGVEPCPVQQCDDGLVA